MNIKEDEKIKLLELRELLSHNEISSKFQFTDIKLLRFLRGRAGNVEKSYQALIKHAIFLEEYDVDNLNPSKFPIEHPKGVAIIHGKCRKGRPIIFSSADRHNGSDRDINEVKLFIIYTLEQALKLSNPNEERLCVLIDLSAFTMKNNDFEVSNVLVNILQNQYPETLSLGIIIDAPWIFQACWNVIYPWLDPVTKQKIKFMKHTMLSEFIEEEQLPLYYRQRFPNDFHGDTWTTSSNKDLIANGVTTSSSSSSSNASETVDSDKYNVHNNTKVTNNTETKVDNIETSPAAATSTDTSSL